MNTALFTTTKTGSSKDKVQVKIQFAFDYKTIIENDLATAQAFTPTQVFELANESLIQGLSKELERSINEFEPRILIIEISALKALSTEGLIEINVAYEIRATNNRSNIVFPFYLNEGTSIK